MAAVDAAVPRVTVMVRKARRLAACFLSILAIASGAAAQNWSPTGSSSSLRFGSTTTLLSTGQVLVVGGIPNGFGPVKVSELYDLATGKWTASGAIARNRFNHTATLLPSGQTLIAGGLVQKNPSNQDALPTASVEIYDRATGAWSATGSMNDARWQHTATLLPSGQLLVVGGFTFSIGDVGSDTSASAELYDPASRRWTRTGSLTTARGDHTATLLHSGKVLVAGGQDGDTPLASAEIYDPATGLWTPTGTMVSAHDQQTATLLPSGQVLVAGGLDQSSSTVVVAELYDPTTGRWTQTQSLSQARQSHTANLLPSGKVLVAGGLQGNFVILSSAELYDPATGVWSATGMMNGARWLHSAILLSSSSSTGRLSCSWFRSRYLISSVRSGTDGMEHPRQAGPSVLRSPRSRPR